MQKYYFYMHAEHQSIFVSTQQHHQHKLAFVWLYCTLDHTKQSDTWHQACIENTEIDLNDYHVQDIANPEHPSGFESTEEYDLLIFRKLATSDDHFHISPDILQSCSSSSNDQDHLSKQHMDHHAHLNQANMQGFHANVLETTPMSFCISSKALITIIDPRNRALQPYLDRLTAVLDKATSNSNKNQRLPRSPFDLTLKLLYVVIDRYMEIRPPLTQRVNYWQSELLQSNKRFTDWQDLFQENLALQQIDDLCEEQIEVLQALRDDITENQAQLSGTFFDERQDITLVRMHDLLSHVERVQQHVTRLQSMLKSAIDLHFSAISNQTNENMRFLAIITAIFSPMSLLTGMYGMNFEMMPGLKNPYGFWIMLFAMLCTTGMLLYIFRRKRLMGNHKHNIHKLLAQHQPIDFRQMK